MCDLSMGSSAELTLGRPCHAASHGAFSGDTVERMSKLEYYLKSLEDERKKIEAFKRELPFCMQLINDEIEASKEQLADYQEPPVNPQSIVKSTCEDHPSAKSGSTLPVLEEFMPIKKPAEDVQEKDVNTVSKNLKGTKPNGVIQTKFWSQAEAYAHGQEMVSTMTDKPYKKRDSMRMGGDNIDAAKPMLGSQNRGGAFVPFSGGKKPTVVEQLDVSPRFQDGEASPCADMTRSSSISEGMHHQHHPIKETQNVTMAAATSYSNAGQATQRKPRRCWSPELHRRFVNALQQLGGSEVATPKQIRELMKVDGLTNDEVKSHLQKYRLHTRRPNASFHTATAHTPQVVVLGGIWVPQEYTAQAAASVNQGVPQQQEPADRQLATPSYSEERYIQLNSANMHHALYYNGEARTVATQSQGSSKGPVNQLSAHSSDPGREDESLGDEGNEGSSWKGGYPEEDREHDENVESYAGASPHVHKWMYKNAAHESGEDDSEAEDGMIYETPS